MLQTENQEREKREKTMCSQLEKATEIIMICSLIDPHFGNYGSQQVIFSGNQANTLSFSKYSLLISMFVQISVVILSVSENMHLLWASKFSFKFPPSCRPLLIQ